MKKRKLGRKLLGFLLTLAMLVGLMPGMSLTAYANSVTSWDEDQTIETTQEISGGVTVGNNITVTVFSGVVLTVNGGINANDKTVTVKGPGTLIINGATGSNGVDAEGEAGDYGFAGNIIVDGATVTVTGGTGGIGGSDGDTYTGCSGGSGGNGVVGNVTVNSGSIEVTGGTGGNGGGCDDEGGNGGNGGIGVNGTVTVTGGSATLAGGTGGNGGYGFNGGNGGNGGIGVNGTVTVTGGLATLAGGIGGEAGSGNVQYGENGENGEKGVAVSGTITGSAEESDDNNAWTAVSGDSSTKQYVKVGSAHTHSFTYKANGATITATCSADGCTLPLVDGKHTATLTIGAPLHIAYNDGKDAAAQITDANSIKGDAKVQYQKKIGGSYGTATETAPTDAGDYKASITVGGATASVEYTIAKADPTANAPTGLTATYGQTLANVSLEGKNPEGNTEGSWAWVDNTQSVGDVVSPAVTFKANFTPTDTSNYKTVENVGVTVTVSKAANPTTVTSTASVKKGGNTVDLASNITLKGATGEVTYAFDGDANGCTLNGSVLTSGDNTGNVTVNVSVAADNNYNALAATPITVTISDKGTQTITASDVTASYGDTSKKVTATTSGNGTISYAVKSGSEEYIDIDATTGVLTIKKIGTATVIITAAETDTFAQATKEVTVTITKAAATPATVTANNRTYDGTDKPLVNVTGTATGGEMQYALGTDATTAPANNLYTTSIPTATNVGTYYVWYMVKGDENHNDTEPQMIEVKIKLQVFSVYFNMNGHGDAIPAQSVEKDKPVTKPADPKSEGYLFKGWFKDALCSESYDFATPVTADITLYAGWEQDISGVEDEANDWNLYEDPSARQFLIKGAKAQGTVENSNERSKEYYDAKLEGAIVTVSVKGDRKKAAKKANATLEFKLADGSVVEFSLPVSYVKPEFKLTSASGTIKEGAESVLKTGIMVKGDGKIFRPYDMTGVTVSGTGAGSASKGADGSIEVKAAKAGKVTISISKEGWDDSNPVTLTYTVKAVARDVLDIYPAITSAVVLNSNAKGQTFSYDVTLNGAAPAEGAVEIIDNKSSGLAAIKDGKLVIAYREGVKAGKYTITLKAGEAAKKVNIRVSDKALNKAVKLEPLRRYDVVTGASMLARATLKDVGGTVESVTVAEEGFTARPSGNGTILIGYSGDKYNKRNLKIGKLTLSFKISGIEEPVTITMKNVKAKMRIPSVKAATVIIPGDQPIAEGGVIGTANIVSSVYLSYGRYIILEPVGAKIMGSKNVTARVNESDFKEINIEKLEKKSGWIKVRLTYKGDVTKTIKVKVKRAGK